MNQELLADAYFQYIVSAIMAGKRDDAAQQFEKMSAHFPHHPKRQALASIMHAHKAATRAKHLYVLAIGVDKYAYRQQFGGCVNDANLFMETLESVWSDHAEIHKYVLLDEQATASGVEESLQRLKDELEPSDVFVLFFSGQAGIPPAPPADKTAIKEYCLMTVDSPRIIDSQSSLLKGSAIHEAISAMPASQKFLIIDSNADADLMQQAELSGNYTLMFGCGDGEQAYENNFSGKKHGVFTFALTQVVKDVIEKGDVNLDLYAKVVELIKSRNFRQTPQMIGDITPLFIADAAMTPQEEKQVFFHGKSVLSEKHFNALNGKMRAGADYYWPVLKKMGQYWLRKNDAIKAAPYLEKYAGLEKNIDNIINAVDAFDGMGAYDKAEALLEQWIQQEKPAEDDPIQALAAIYAQYNKGDRAQYALIVGISQYEALEPLPAARKDAEKWEQFFLHDLQCPRENVTVLLDGAATRARILAEFDKHVKYSESHPVLFFFAGYGAAYDLENLQSAAALMKGGLDEAEISLENNDSIFTAALLSVDARTTHVPDLLFSELQARYTGNHLVSIFDMGVDKNGSRGQRPMQENAKGLGFAAPQRKMGRIADSIRFSVGNATFMPGALHSTQVMEKKKIWCVETEEGGIFTASILELLRSQADKKFSLDALQKTLSRKKTGYTTKAVGENHYLSPTIVGLKEAPLFSPYRLGRPAIEKIRQSPLQDLKNQLQQLSASVSSDFPEHPVNLAITHAALGEIEMAIHLLTNAAVDETAESLRHVKANYHLGRVLVETSAANHNENWSQALSALRTAQVLQPNFVAINYYLGKAINQLSFLEGRMAAAKAFSEYEKNGYPIGFRDEVDAFLDSLDDQRLRKRRMEEALRYMGNADYVNAEKALLEALQLGENLAHYHLGEIYEQQRDSLRAINAYQQALLKNVEKDDLPYKLGNMLRTLLSDKNILDKTLDTVKKYNDNDAILRNNETQSLLEDLEKLKTALSGVAVRNSALTR